MTDHGNHVPGVVGVGTGAPRRPWCRTSRAVRRAFTLIELMAVMVIMLIVLGVTLPAFKNITSSGGVDGAVRLLNAQLRLARQYAISKRSRVAVVMPGPNAVRLDKKYRYSCFRLALVTWDGSSYTFSEWLENAKWQYLPAGSAIMEVDDDQGIQDGSSGTAVPCLNPHHDTFTFVDDMSYLHLDAMIPSPTGSFDARCIVFGSTGRRDDSGMSCHVTVGEAAFLGGSDWVIKTPATTTTNRSTANQYTIEIDRYTGRTIIKTPEEY